MMASGGADNETKKEDEWDRLLKQGSTKPLPPKHFSLDGVTMNLNMPRDQNKSNVCRGENPLVDAWWRFVCQAVGEEVTERYGDRRMCCMDKDECRTPREFFECLHAGLDPLTERDEGFANETNTAQERKHFDYVQWLEGCSAYLRTICYRKRS